MQLAVSTVIFALREPDRRSARTGNHHAGPVLSLPLVRRVREPFDSHWALPGGPIHSDEALHATAARTLADITGLRPAYLEQLHTFGDPDRSRVGERMISVVYWALVGQTEAAQARPGQNVRWLAADELPQLAFDHNAIVDHTLGRLRAKVEDPRIAHSFLGETFTLRQLREVHEVILGRCIDPANFRRQIEAAGAVIPTDSFQTGTHHRPARLYRYNSDGSSA